MPDAASSPVWLPVLTAFGGYVAGFVSEWFRDQRARKRDSDAAEATRTRDREARDATRREQLFERRTTFQRQTLLGLQEAVQKLVRITGEIHHIDEMASRTSGAWGRQLVGADLDARAYLANAETTKLGVRIRDVSVRTLLQELKDKSSTVTLSRSKADADGAALAMMNAFIQLNERIGELLRKLDDDEDDSERAISR